VRFSVSGSDYLILFWVGSFALFKAFSRIMLTLGVRHAGKEAAAGLPSPA
jgi:hypothetical protein